MEQPALISVAVLSLNDVMMHWLKEDAQYLQPDTNCVLTGKIWLFPIWEYVKESGGNLNWLIDSPQKK